MHFSIKGLMGNITNNKLGLRKVVVNIEIK
jgi:hypothetical protein